MDFNKEEMDYPPLFKKRKSTNNFNGFSNFNQKFNMHNLISKNFPKFLVMKKTVGDFSKDSPFFVAKTLKNIASYENVKKIKEGLLIETNNFEDSSKFLKIKLFGNCEVTVVPHNSLNSSRGVVRCKDLLNCSVEEIQQGFADQLVTNVRRITTRRDGVITNTTLLVLTFSTPDLPATVMAGYHCLRVRQYIPNPLRCFNCQKFGHSVTNCSNTKICVCGKPSHEGSPCTNPLVCVNCSGPHSAAYKACPSYKLEASIQELKTKERLSYFEARKKVQSTQVKPFGSYSQVAASVSTPAPSAFPTSFNLDLLISKLVPVLVAALKGDLIAPVCPASTPTPTADLKINTKSNKQPINEPKTDSQIKKIKENEINTTESEITESITMSVENSSSSETDFSEFLDSSLNKNRKKNKGKTKKNTQIHK